MTMDTDTYRAALASTLANDSAAGHPKWLHAARSEALDAFLETGFPSVKLENWRYTDLAPMAKASAAAISDTPATGSAKLPAIDADNLTLAFINGKFSSDASNVPGLPAGCVVSNIASELDQDEAPDWLSTEVASSSLAHLNLAMLNDGAVVRIADNTELNGVIHIVYSNTAGAQVFPRVSVQLGKNAKATVVEHHVSDGTAVSTAVTTLRCEAGAQLSYQKLQEEHADSFHVAAQNVYLAKDATCNIVNIDLGASIARNDLHVMTQGSGAEVTINGLFLVDGDRHADNHLHLEHQVAHTSSRAHYAGVMANKGRGVFNGMIHVHQEAQKTDAALYNKNLLLTKGAEIDTKPELEIYADDVKCAHGSTTGQLDPTSLFYLRARGVPEQDARNMLVQAFATEVVQQLATDGLQKHVLASVEARLNDIGVVVDS